MKRKPASASHDEAIIRRLRKDPQFAAEYLKAALEDDGEPRVLLIALRHSRSREASAKVARAAGVEREKPVSRALSERQSTPFHSARSRQSSRTKANRRSRLTAPQPAVHKLQYFRINSDIQPGCRTAPRGPNSATQGLRSSTGDPSIASSPST